MRSLRQCVLALALFAPSISLAQPVEVARYVTDEQGYLAPVQLREFGLLTVSAFRESAGVNADGQALYRYYFQGEITSPTSLYDTRFGDQLTRLEYIFGSLRFRNSGAFPGTVALFGNLVGSLVQQPQPFRSPDVISAVATLPTAESWSARFNYRTCNQGRCDFETSGIFGPLKAQALVTPEPSTWVLLGSGLLTLGGIAARRRRQHG